MGDHWPRKCALCEKLASPKSGVLCEKHRKLAKEQTERLEREYRRLTMEVTLESYDA